MLGENIRLVNALIRIDTPMKVVNEQETGLSLLLLCSRVLTDWYSFLLLSAFFFFFKCQLVFGRFPGQMLR